MGTRMNDQIPTPAGKSGRDFVIVVRGDSGCVVSRRTGRICEFKKMIDTTAWGQWLILQASESGDRMSSQRALLQAKTILSTTVGAAAGFMVILIIGIYLASEPSFYVKSALRLVPPARRTATRDILHDVGRHSWAWHSRRH